MMLDPAKVREWALDAKTIRDFLRGGSIPPAATPQKRRRDLESFVDVHDQMFASFAGTAYEAIPLLIEWLVEERARIIEFEESSPEWYDGQVRDRSTPSPQRIVQARREILGEE